MKTQHQMLSSLVKSIYFLNEMISVSVGLSKTKAVKSISH